jgi:hypothetical protein
LPYEALGVLDWPPRPRSRLDVPVLPGAPQQAVAALPAKSRCLVCCSTAKGLHVGDEPPGSLQGPRRGTGVAHCHFVCGNARLRRRTVEWKLTLAWCAPLMLPWPCLQEQVPSLALLWWHANRRTAASELRTGYLKLPRRRWFRRSSGVLQFLMLQGKRPWEWDWHHCALPHSRQGWAKWLTESHGREGEIFFIQPPIGKSTSREIGGWGHESSLLGCTIKPPSNHPGTLYTTCMGHQQPVTATTVVPGPLHETGAQ